MPDNKEELEYCRVTVNGDGVATARYKWKDNEVEGSDTHDEDMFEWTDDDIRDCFCGIIGYDGDKSIIEVDWD